MQSWHFTIHVYKHPAIFLLSSRQKNPQSDESKITRFSEIFTELAALRLLSDGSF